MTKLVDYYFSPTSPWTYLGHQRFAEIARRHGAGVNVKPVDYGRIFPVSGGLPLKQRAAQRQAYRFMELRRFREQLGVPLNLEPKHFPTGADPAALAIIAAGAHDGAAAAMKLARAALRACWAEERDIADAATLAAIVRAEGLDPGAILGDAALAAAKAKYEGYTQEAIERGVFGAPTYAIDDELFWGQDRLEFVDRKLGR